MASCTLILATVVCAHPALLQPGDHLRPLEVDKRTRSYLVHLPPRYDGSRAVPVVLAFHGGGSNAEQMVTFCGLNQKADKEGFMVVYPNGTGRPERVLTWNAGNCCGYAQRQKVDDVAFTKALLDDLGKVARVDPKRVYATGISNGGMIAYRLASELSDRIAAIAVHKTAADLQDARSVGWPPRLPHRSVLRLLGRLHSERHVPSAACRRPLRL